MRLISALLIAPMLLSGAHAGEIGSFKASIERFETAYPCSDRKVTPASDGQGALYGCVDGKAQTAKYFINEDPKTGLVKNIKLIWNDWSKDTGYGLHADQAGAFKMLHALVSEYAPDNRPPIVAAFYNDKPLSVNDRGLIISYKFSRGPAIDERVVTVTPIP